MNYTNEQLELALTLHDTPKVKLLEIIVSQGAKLEALEKDAKRFRWLVTQNGLYSKHRAVYECFVEGFTEKEMITAIDAAIAGEAT